MYQEIIAPEIQIAHTIAAYRRATGLTSSQLAEISGITLDCMNRMEKGTANPSLRILKRLAFGMGMHLKLEFVPGT